MKTLYLDCGMGAAGDMLGAALLELFSEPEQMIAKLNALNIPHVEYAAERVQKCGISGTHLSVRIHGEEEGVHAHHSHHSLADIGEMIYQLNVSEKVKNDVRAVYESIAEAESQVHGCPVTEIHFHEVGSLDAVADVTAVCYFLDKLSPEKIICSPVHVGSGQVACAHGILPVPAPATAYLLKNCPIYGGSISGELCTPTGAALLKYFVDEFGNLPLMRTSSIGYGCGKKDFAAANCVRALLGETEGCRDVMYELSCNVDDMTAEQIGFALEQCFAAGAVEAFTIPINMKKSRPGTLLRVICRPELKEMLIRTIFLHTSTAGIREMKAERSVLERKITEHETQYGTVRCKEYSGYGVKRSKYEYEDLARIAREQGMSIEEVQACIKNKD